MQNQLSIEALMHSKSLINFKSFIKFAVIFCTAINVCYGASGPTVTVYITNNMEDATPLQNIRIDYNGEEGMITVEDTCGFNIVGGGTLGYGNTCHFKIENFTFPECGIVTYAVKNLNTTIASDVIWCPWKVSFPVYDPSNLPWSLHYSEGYSVIDPQYPLAYHIADKDEKRNATYRLSYQKYVDGKTQDAHIYNYVTHPLTIHGKVISGGGQFINPASGEITGMRTDSTVDFQLPAGKINPDVISPSMSVIRYFTNNEHVANVDIDTGSPNNSLVALYDQKYAQFFLITRSGGLTSYDFVDSTGELIRVIANVGLYDKSDSFGPTLKPSNGSTVICPVGNSTRILECMDKSNP